MPSGDFLPGDTEIYRTQVSHAAFLLGFSYFEAFLSDTIRMIFRCRTAMLPRDKKIAFGDLVDLDGSMDMIGLLIEREVRDVMFDSFESIERYFAKRLNIEWPPFARLAEASAIRNCIVHNMARADDRLVDAGTKWRLRQEIAQTPSDVHAFGRFPAWRH